MDFLDITPQQEQQLMAQALRAKQLLGENTQKANRFGTLSAVAQLANNPAVAQAALQAHKNAQAQYDTQSLGQQGFALPGQGEFVESPIYQRERMATRNQQEQIQKASLAAAAQAQADRLAAQQQMQGDKLQAQRERDQQNSMLRMTLAQMAGQRAMDVASLRASQKADAPTFKETDIQKLGQFADKKQLPRLLLQGRQLVDQFKQFGDETPGFSAKEQALQKAPFGLGAGQLSPEAVDNMTAIAGIYNGMTRADAGLSQTLNEVQRQALETFNSPLVPAKVRIQAFRKHILPVLEQSRSAVLGTAPPAALAEYRKRMEGVGGSAQWLDPLDLADKPAAAVKQQAPSWLPPGVKLIGPAP